MLGEFRSELYCSWTISTGFSVVITFVTWVTSLLTWLAGMYTDSIWVEFWNCTVFLSGVMFCLYNYVYFSGTELLIIGGGKFNFSRFIEASLEWTITCWGGEESSPISCLSGINPNAFKIIGIVYLNSNTSLWSFRGAFSITKSSLFLILLLWGFKKSHNSKGVTLFSGLASRRLATVPLKMSENLFEILNSSTFWLNFWKSKE